MTDGASITEPARPTRSGGATPDALYALSYRSHSLLPGGAGAAGLAHILRVARHNNAALGVTGALLLYGDWFAQLLEGPAEVVRGLFDRIAADPRHDGVELLDRGPVDKRLFERWAMASVGEHGEVDTPLMAVGEVAVPAGGWRLDAEQDARLARLRQATRGYGRGS